ncbi:MAG: DMT family transporter [Rhodospirillales bacterium]|jgi:drug/metabolite transporter (DMT)-like permease|nr:DMT family transporter [Rhodospirillales bacterium]
MPLFDRVRACSVRLARLPRSTRGALAMIASGASFAVMMAMVRLLSDDLHPFVSAFFRNALGLVFLMPWVAGAGFATLRTGRFRVHGLRAAFGLGAMLCLFTALSRMPLAEVTALSFTAPLFATVGAALVLRERVRLRRWTATFAGFCGAVIVLRPGMATIDPTTPIALTAAVFMAAAMLSVKSLSRTEHPNAIVFMMGALMAPASLIPALFVWTPPSAADVPWLLLMGLSATIGQVLLTRAFSLAEASAVMPYGFSQLVFVSVLGYAIFGERPDLWTWVGGAVIVAASVYIARREAKLDRVRDTTVAP